MKKEIHLARIHTTDIRSVLSKLAVLRPVFHSEADFQHALAWELHGRWQNSEIRLEFRPPHVDKRVYVDIWASRDDTKIAIELKYKTRKLEIRIGQETFKLLNQSAQDIGRYDFVKDVERLERIVSCRNGLIGYAILLTNDSAYWKTPRSSSTVDASFRIHQGRVLTGTLSWGPGASKGTMRGREQAINIERIYTLNWQDFSEPSQGPYGGFRYVVVKVES